MMIKILSLYSVVIICLFSSIILFTYSWKKNHSKNVLGIFMLTLFVFFTTVAIYQLKYYFLYSYLDGIYAFYVRSLSRNTKLNKKDLLHFIPAFVFLLLISIAYKNIAEKQELEYLRSMLFSNLIVSDAWVEFLQLLRIGSQFFYVVQSVFYNDPQLL